MVDESRRVWNDNFRLRTVQSRDSLNLTAFQFPGRKKFGSTEAWLTDSVKLREGQLQRALQVLQLIHPLALLLSYG